MDSADHCSADINQEDELGLPVLGTVFKVLAGDFQRTRNGWLGKQINPSQDAAQRNPDMDKGKSD